MKSKLITLTILVLAFVLAGFAEQTKIIGVLTDNMCTKKHMMSEKTNADCARDCAKHGAKYVVVSEGKIIELKGNVEQISPLAGKKVTVSGNLTGNTLSVASIEAVQ